MSSSIALKEDSKDYTGYGFNCFHIVLYAILAKWEGGRLQIDY